LNNKIKVVNKFWVTGDILVILPGGPTQEVFRLTSSIEDATMFGLSTAHTVAEMMNRRLQQLFIGESGHAPTFKPVPSEKPQGLWLVYGKQEAEVDPEG
jgi:hypothetical protein